MSTPSNQMVFVPATGSAAATAASGAATATVSQAFTPGFDAQSKSKTERDFLLPFDDLKRRAEAGDASAQLLIGIMISWGAKGCIPDLDEGKKWIVKASQSSENSPAVLCAKAYCYLRAFGDIKIRNIAKGIEFLEAAVRQGYVPAIHELGVTLCRESITTTESNSGYHVATHTHKDTVTLKRAATLIADAAELGYDYSIHYLGICYRDGNGVQQNQVEAVKLFKIAAEAGVVYAKSDLGHCYEYGLGVAKDNSEACKWYKAATAQGLNCSAQINRTSCCCTIM